MLIPLKVDVPLPRHPWVNYGLMVLIVIVSIAAFYDEDILFRWAGIDPAAHGITAEELEDMSEEEIARRVERWHTPTKPTLHTEETPMVVLAVTSTLLHGGWVHLIGNMLFLWIFGNAVNAKLGHLLYVAFYLAAGFAASMAHYLFAGGPVVGASGAINGVMGAFLVFFPLNAVKMFYWFRFRAGTFDLAGLWVILLYVAWDVLCLVIGVQTGTAFRAHIGGFVVGFSAALALLLTGAIKPEPDERSILSMFGRQ